MEFFASHYLPLATAPFRLYHCNQRHHHHRIVSINGVTGNSSRPPARLAWPGALKLYSCATRTTTCRNQDVLSIRFGPKIITGLRILLLVNVYAAVPCLFTALRMVPPSSIVLPAPWW